MGVVVSLQIEQARLKGRDKGAKSEAQDNRERVERMHLSVSAFERAMDEDQYARLCRELGGDVGRDASDFLRKINQVEHCNAPLNVKIGMTAIIAGRIRKYTRELFHKASVIAAGVNSGSEGRACLRDDGAGLR